MFKIWGYLLFNKVADINLFTEIEADETMPSLAVWFIARLINNSHLVCFTAC